MNVNNMLVTFSPKELHGPISKEPITESDIQNSIEKLDMKLEPKKEPWNEYELENGVKVFLKTVANSVSSTKLYDNYGEPIYVVQHQVLIKKYPI